MAGRPALAGPASRAGAVAPPSPGDRRPQGRAGSGEPARRRPGAGCARLARGTRAGQPLHGGPGPAGVGGAGGRRVRAVPADPDARLQHRRRRRGGDLAGRAACSSRCPSGEARGPGGAVPGPHDAAVRDRGSADRAVPRPVRARPPLGDRRDDGGPGVPVLGARLVGRAAARRSSSPPRWACSSRPRRTASPGPPPYPACSPATSPSSRPTAGSRWRASSAPRSRRRSPALASLAGSEWSLRYAFVLFVIATICAIRLPAAVDSSEGEGELVVARQGGQHVTARPPAHPDPRPGGVRAARQLRAVVPQRLPADVRRVPAPRPRRPAGQRRSAPA